MKTNLYNCINCTSENLPVENVQRIHIYFIRPVPILLKDIEVIKYSTFKSRMRDGICYVCILKHQQGLQLAFF